MRESLETAGAVVRLSTRPSRPLGDALSVQSVDLEPVQGSGLSVFMFDEFRVQGHPFAPHPHAGFSAITYVLPDSACGLRSRDSLGHDIVVGPGGIVWTQAGRGALHEELPSQPGRSLHGLQVFVHLPGELKLSEPRVMHLDGPDVPVWSDPAGTQVRVVVGRHADRVSPLQPSQPFRWLDVTLHGELEIDLPAGHRMLAHGLAGSATVLHEGRRHALTRGHALALAGSSRPLRLNAATPCRLVLLSGPAIHESTVGQGPFVMADAGQLRDAVRRYHAGEMGRLDRADA